MDRKKYRKETLRGKMKNLIANYLVRDSYAFFAFPRVSVIPSYIFFEGQSLCDPCSIVSSLRLNIFEPSCDFHRSFLSTGRSFLSTRRAGVRPTIEDLRNL